MADPNKSTGPANQDGKAASSTGNNNNSNNAPVKSAMSSPGPGGSSNSPKHDRKVSWGAIMPELKNQKQGTGDNAAAAASSKAKDNNSASQSKQQPPSPSSSSSAQAQQQKISVSDVVNTKPMEEEAQSHILRAVEKMQSGHYRSQSANDPETDSLLRDIAHDEISRASKEAAEREKEAMDAAPEDEDDEEKAERVSLLDNNSQSKSNAGQTQSSVMNKGRFKSLVQKNVINNKNKKDQGVEHTLFGLTAALTQAEKERKAESTNKLADTATKLAGTGGDVENQVQEEDTSDSEDETSEELGASTDPNQKKKKKKKKHKHMDQVKDGIGENWTVFSQFFNPKSDKVEKYVKKAGMYIVLPCLGLAAVLFYFQIQKCETETRTVAPAATRAPATVVVIEDGDNSTMTNSTRPPRDVRDILVCPGGASTSWFFLFIVRQVITFTMALITQAFVVDFLCLRTRICLNWAGPIVTMLLAQSKGWPFSLTFWSVYDLILLSGSRAYAHHWLYWQDAIDLFNEKNPSGTVVEDRWYNIILRLAIFVGVIVSIKRLIVTLFLGRQTFSRYGEQLAEIMKHMVLVGEVATLSKDIEKYSGEYANSETAELISTPSKKNVRLMVEEEADALDVKEEEKVNAAQAAKSYIEKHKASTEPDMVSQVSSRTLQEEEFTQSEQMKLSELLDSWEEPETVAEKEERKISIGAVLQFRQALTFMRTKYPFLPAFGLADTREQCVDNASKVFDRLLLRSPDRVELPFDTLALLAKDEKDGIDTDKAKLLIKIFRPDRQGNLSKLDFVKSIDTIYKSIRMLSANISNSSQIDKAVEKIINIIFYIILGAICLSSLEIDPMEVFLSLSGLTLAFAFMFGSSSANFFEGVLFILVHAPYGVGDRVHLSSPSSGTSIDGSSGWIVEKVSLYTTAFYWGATNERCTINNGAISRLRVINSNRSPNAQLFIFMKFNIDTPYEKFEIAKQALEQYCKDRPREWLYFFCFRPTDVAVEGNYISYMTIVCHREPWQNVGAVLQSKSELVTYQLEVCKQLGIGYEQPHLPVDVRFGNNGQAVINNGQPQSGELGPSELAALAASHEAGRGGNE